MKQSFSNLRNAVVITALLGTLPAHANVKQSMGDFFFKRKAGKAIESYTDNTVLKSLELMVDDIKSLNVAAQNLHKVQTDINLAATTDAWKKVSASLNRSVIFFYGPVAHYDFNKELAIWPFDKVLVEHALGEMEAGNLTFTSKSLRERTASMRGLNTIKYLLFRDGKQRVTTDITKTEFDYLTVATKAMVEEGLKMQASWVGSEDMSDEDNTILTKAGLTKKWKGYAYEFKNPGEPDSRYFSLSVPLQELIQESMTVVEDMVPAIEELADFDENTLNYWDSFDPYADLLSLLEGVENSYLGGVEGSRGASFSELVAMKDEVLDVRIKTALVSVGKRIRAIQDAPEGKREMAIKVAASECGKLAARIMTATPLVTADPAVEPFAPYGSDLKK